MKNNKRSTITIAMAALVITAVFAVFRDTQIVSAQNQTPPPVADRISFGMVGITAGQTMRVNVSNIIAADDSVWPPGPSRVAIMVINSRGRAVRNRNGEVIGRVVQLERGDSTFLDLDFGDHPPPVGDRLQLRAVVTVQVPPPTGDEPPPIGDRIVSTVEVINNANGRTQFVAFSTPASIRAFNPQPDPPLGN